MKRCYYPMFIILIAVGISTFAQPLSAGPMKLKGNSISAFAVNPFDHKELYAGTEFGAFKSTDGGRTWVPINHGLKNREILSLTADPVERKTVYCATRQGAFKSINGGNRWTAIGCGVSDEVAAIAVDPRNASTSYAIARDSVWMMATGVNEDGEASTVSSNCDGLLRISDWGKTCSFIGDFLDINLKIECIAVDPTDSDTLYLGTRNGLYRSTNRGEEWPFFSRALDKHHVKSITIDPRNGSVLYAAATEGIFKSTDGGDNWSEIRHGLPTTEILAIVVDPSNSLNLYVGTERGAFQSKDGGDSWYAVSGDLGRLPIKSLHVDPKRNLLYAATTEGIFKSANFGESWASVTMKTGNRSIGR